MRKAEIIAKSLKQVQDSDSATTLWTGPESSYKAYLKVALARKFAHLYKDTNILTCADFKHAGVKCCPTCHGD
jgi:hypothetical protein